MNVVAEHPSALTITDHDGLVWTLRLVDPDWPRMLRRLVRDIAAVDRRHAELVVDQLPAPWDEGYRIRSAL